MALIAVLVGVGRVQVIDIEILLIDGEDGQAKGDLVVVADDDPRLSRFDRADHRQARRVQVSDIADRWDAQAAMGIIGQDRSAGGGAGPGDHPVVRAFLRRRPLQHGQLAAVRLEGDLLGGQDIVAQHLGGHVAWIQALGRLDSPGRLDRLAQPVGGQAGQAGYAGAGDFRGDIAGQGVAADADNVLRPPIVRLAVGDGKFDRQGRLAGPHPGHIGVDPGREGLGARLGPGAIGGPLGRHVAAIQEQSGGAVFRDESGAKALGQLAQAPLAPQVHLPQPVARGVIALDEKGVVIVAGIDVRHAPVVDQNLGRLVQPGNGGRVVAHGARQGGIGRRGRQPHRQYRRHRRPDPEPLHAVASLILRAWSGMRLGRIIQCLRSFRQSPIGAKLGAWPRNTSPKGRGRGPRRKAWEGEGLRGFRMKLRGLIPSTSHSLRERAPPSPHGRR